ncbi:MAG: hypothetical protein BZ151_00435 [Desulfobacca sp. 4484_104]|nr:MAG: hypothetical protein BZ151_00435 [Desulfobacca sp. 4484_104]
MEVLLILLGIFSSSFLIALSGALMPGPLLTITITEASRRGFWAGPLIILGHGLLEFTLLILLLLGVGAVVNQPYIMGAVALLGAGLLWWMGLGLLKEARQAQLSLTQNHGRSIHPVWAGILMSVANPYWLIWWLTLGLGYLIGFGCYFGFQGVRMCWFS